MRSVLLTYLGPAAAVLPFLTAGAAVAGVGIARKSDKQAKSAAAQQRVAQEEQLKLQEEATIKQDKEIARQAETQAKQDKLVTERATREEAKTTERRGRLARGRKGLLFQGKETGVTKDDTLGG